MQGENRAWKLFALVPCCFCIARNVGSVGRDELAKKADRLVRGQWSGLIAGVRSCTSHTCPSPQNNADDQMRRGLQLRAEFRGVRFPEHDTS